jgi:hypothetical protein
VNIRVVCLLRACHGGAMSAKSNGISIRPLARRRRRKGRTRGSLEIITDSSTYAAMPLHDNQAGRQSGNITLILAVTIMAVAMIDCAIDHTFWPSRLHRSIGRDNGGALARGPLPCRVTPPSRPRILHGGSLIGMADRDMLDVQGKALETTAHPPGAHSFGAMSASRARRLYLSVISAYRTEVH